MINKISRKEIEDLIKKTYDLKDLEYYRNYGYEGYGKDNLCDWEFIEGEEND